MVTLANLNGRSLALDLDAAFSGPLEKRRDIRREDEGVARDVDLLRTAQGLAPASDVKSKGFLRTIAPGLADQLDGMNKKRDVGEIDGFRSEAKMSVDTAKAILGAKSPAEKQKIILARAREFQSSGRDNRQLLKMSGMSPAEMDLQAQKAQLTGDATLRALPAPTGGERQAARAELAIRNPQAFNGLLREEAIERQIANQKAAQGRAGASKAAKAADAKAAAEFGAAFRGEVNGGSAPEGGTSAPVAATDTPFINTSDAGLSFGSDVGGSGSGLVESAQEQLAGVTDPVIVPLAEQVLAGAQSQEATARDLIALDAGIPQQDPGLSFGDLGAAPAVATSAVPEPVDMVAQADTAFRAAQADTDRAIALRDSYADPKLRALAQNEVKRFEATEKAALEDRQNEIKFAESQEVEAPDLTPLGQQVTDIGADVQSGILTPEQGAAARSSAVAESLKSPNTRILTEAEAREKLGETYDDTKTYQQSPTGTISPIGGGGVVVNTGNNDEAVKLTERQSALTLFGSMMATTQPVFDVLEGTGFDAGGMETFIATKLGDAGNFFQTPEGRQYNAAKSAWAEGVLRIQTGAAATQPEINRVQNTYFASVGDDASTIAFKRQLRESYGEALGLGSGGLINPNDIKNSVITAKVGGGQEVLSPGTFAGITAARPDLSPADIAAYFDGLTPEQQTAVNDQFK